MNDYIGLDAKAKVFRASGGARYLMNRNVSVNFDLSYGDRSREGPLNSPVFSEVRSLLGVTFQL